MSDSKIYFTHTMPSTVHMQASSSFNVDLTASQWLQLLALPGRNNILLVRWKCLRWKGGYGVNTGRRKNVLCQFIRSLIAWQPQCHCEPQCVPLMPNNQQSDGWRLMKVTMHNGTQ